MNYFGKIISNISQAYSEINPATLTGAIDVIVVEQEDGQYLTSPFHVRFGKMGVLRSREKIVDIEINGIPVDIHMKLGDGGEAYFLEECDDDDDEGEEIENNPPSPIASNDSNIDSLDQTSTDSTTLTTELINAQDNHHAQDLELDSHNQKNSQSSPKKESVLQNSSDSSDKTDQQHSTIKTETTPGSQKRTRRKKKKTGHGRQMSNAESSTVSNLIDIPNNNSDVKNEDKLKNAFSENNLHPFSDSEADPKKPKESIMFHSSDYKSDSEIEIVKTEKTQNQDNISWDWGELPNINKNNESPMVGNKEKKSMLGGVLNFMIKDKDKDGDNNKDDDKGIYLDELDPNDMKPEVAAKYFPKFRSSLSSSNNNNNKSDSNNNNNIVQQPITTTSSDEDIESGKGASLSNSPRSMDCFNSHYLNSDLIDQVKEQIIIPGDLYSLSRIYHDMSMSLCGRIEDLIENPHNTERFLQSIISFDDFSENPLQILENPNLVIRMGGQYYTLKMASALLFSLLLFQRPLSDKTISDLKEKCIPKKTSPQNSRSWRSWFRSPTTEQSNGGNIDSLSSSPTNNNGFLTATNSKNGQLQSPSSESKSFVNETNVSNYYLNSNYEKYSSSSNNNNNSTNSNSSIEYVSDEETYNQLVISNSARNSTTKANHTNSDNNTIDGNRKLKFRKVLRLSSDVLKSLNLKPGSNDIMFSVTTAYQGTTASKSKIFLWRYDDKIIISDIDGTITKSDVLGHILPYIGKDWAQSGVTQLYSKVEQNGYKFLYLSARAIGQAKGTRDYLTSICQEGMYLPDGPLLLSPTSLFSALHREVIEKKPEEFKISCLKDIQSLFPVNPFFAGFGNKINDTWAYRAVGIDPSRIFTINHRGELKLDKIIPFKSSYTELSQIVDQMFPPINKDKNRDQENNDDYNLFMYWRTDIPVLDDLELNSDNTTITTSNTITNTSNNK